jgi:DNA-binding CsgD family transcriptional regulator
MNTKPRLRDTVKRLDSALAMVRQDRWQLAGLRSGRLVILAEGPNPARAVGPAQRKPQELTPLARRALFERRSVSISTIQTQPAGGQEDWELDWPTILYAPVGDVGARPCGLLIVGVREPHWYEDEDVNYIAALAGTLAAYVTATADPLRPLNRGERMVAYLLGEGLSSAEISRALRIERTEALVTIGSVLRKLRLKQAAEVAELLEDRRATQPPPVTLAVEDYT